MRNIFQIVCLVVLLFSTRTAYALYYFGGNSDGYAVVSSASQPSIVSAATQTFTFGDGSTAMSAVTITNYPTATGGYISAANGIRVVIPSDMPCVWDTSYTTATITGGASGKVSTTVSYPNSKTLLITVSSDFAAGDTITVSGLQLKTFTGMGTSGLWLSVDGGTTNIIQDSVLKTFIYSPMFIGGTSDGYSTATAYFDRVNGFLGGNGRGEAMVIAGSRAILSMMSTASQSFTVGDPTTLMSALSITQQFSSANGVLTANGIRVKIPAALGMTWDSTVTTATVSGGASGKVSTTVSYENSDKTLVIAATTNFADGDTITVSGLKFKNFTASGDNFLQLEIDNAGTTIEADPYDKFVLVVERSTGFLGGIGRGEIEGDINQGPPVDAIFFGTMF